MTGSAAIAKQDFSRQLMPGKLLNANDTRLASSPPIKNHEEAQKKSGDLIDPFHRVYSDHMHQEIKVDLQSLDHVMSAPKAIAS